MPRKILIIATEPWLMCMLDLLVASFARGPFVAVQATDYATGLRMLTSGEYAVCLVNFQLELNAPNALELQRKAKAMHCNTPVICITNSTEEQCAASEHGMAHLDLVELSIPALEYVVFYQLKLAEDMTHLREVSHRDELTGLYNRRGFNAQLQVRWNNSIELNRPMALGIVDMDKFKEINDTYGHPVGDAVLQHAACIMAQANQRSDCLARLGGDEFALILAESDLASASVKVNHIHKLLLTAPYIDKERNLSIPIESSIGVAAWPECAQTQANLIKAADLALYKAKDQGRNQVALADNAIPEIKAECKKLKES